MTALRTEDTRGPRLLTMGTVALTWGLRASTPLQPHPDAVTRMRRVQGTRLGTQLQCVCLWRRPSLVECPGQRLKGQKAAGVEASPRLVPVLRLAPKMPLFIESYQPHFIVKKRYSEVK